MQFHRHHYNMEDDLTTTYSKLLYCMSMVCFVLCIDYVRGWTAYNDLFQSIVWYGLLTVGNKIN